MASSAPAASPGSSSTAATFLAKAGAARRPVLSRAPRPGRRPGRAPARRRRPGGGVVRHLRPLLGQLGRHAVQHSAHVRPQRRAARRVAGRGHRRGRGLECRHGAPLPTASGPADSCGSRCSPGRCCSACWRLTRDRWSFAVALVAGRGGGRLHRHGHERRGLAPPDGQPRGARPVPRPVQHRRARRRRHRPALLIHAGVSWRWVWPGIAVVALGVGVVGPRHRPGRRGPAPADRPRGAADGDAPSRHPLRRLRADGLLLFLVVFALAEITEGGVDTWGVLYLRNHLATGRAARGRGLRGGPAGGGHHPGRRRPPARPALGPAALIIGGWWPGPASSSSRSPPVGRGRARPGARRRRRLAVLAAGHEHGEPHGQPGRQRRRRLHRRRLRGLGRRRPHRRLGLADTWAPPAACSSWPWPPSAVALCTLLSRTAAQGSAGRPRGSLQPIAMILPSIETPADLKALDDEQLAELAAEIRSFIVDTVTTTGGHLGSNLGAVELTLALHRVFDSPRDVILWDTGHQAYVHKLLTGRRYGFKNLEQAGGHVGLPQPGRVRARLDREQPRLDRPLLRPRDGQRLRAAAARRRAPGGGRRRRRRPDRGHGLRGAQQPGPLGPPRRHRAQRQRPLLRADGVPAVAEPDQPPAQPHLHRSPRAPAQAAARPSRARRARLLGRARR